MAVLFVVAETIGRELQGAALFRSDTERLFAADAEEALQMALARRPSLVFVDGAHEAVAVGLIRRLRENPRTRHCSVVALSRSPSLADEKALREAGANLVLSLPVDPSRWNARLEPLLAVPRRRETGFPVQFESWSAAAGVTEPKPGVALNLSVHGLLLETDERLDVGTRVDLGFELPYRLGAVRALGYVIREAKAEGSSRSGIEFLILRGDARARIDAFVAAR